MTRGSSDRLLSSISGKTRGLIETCETFFVKSSDYGKKGSRTMRPRMAAWKIAERHCTSPVGPEPVPAAVRATRVSQFLIEHDMGALDRDGAAGLST